MHRKITDWYLTAKHWQLFLLLIAVIFCADLVLRNIPVILAMPISTFLIGIFYFIWLWAIASTAQKRLPEELSSSPTIMGVGIVCALIYTLISGYFFFIGFPTYAVVLHLLCMVAMFYAMGFAAKQLMTLKYLKKVSFLEYLGPLILFWWFPIGIWFIQPEVNKFFIETKNA